MRSAQAASTSASSLRRKLATLYRAALATQACGSKASALGYGSAVEHALGSRTIVSGWPGQFAGRFADWTRERRVVVYAGGWS